MTAISGLQRALLALLASVLVTFALPSVAHEISMAEMSVRETAPGQFVWGWTTPGKLRPVAQDLQPKWPDGCLGDAQVVRCGPNGLAGKVGVEGVGKTYSAAIIRIHWRSGEKGRVTTVHTITAAQPQVQLFGAATDTRGAGEVAYAYAVLGVEHILGGIDHLLFVISLLFLVGFQRRLVLTITAFTVAHSLTLAASALGWLTLRGPPVEAVIALSIVLVAAEALHGRDTWTRRWPAMVAFFFGLVHGLGFANALREIGLPQEHVVTALLTFNFGVEVGQLLVVASAFGLTWLLGRWHASGPLAMGRVTPASKMSMNLRTVSLYGIGVAAAFWSISRIAAIAA